MCISPKHLFWVPLAGLAALTSTLQPLTAADDQPTLVATGRSSDPAPMPTAAPAQPPVKSPAAPDTASAPDRQRGIARTGQPAGNEPAAPRIRPMPPTQR